ncbi:MAG: RluA family pseudouridine synthase [Bacteroides sp.]|nr:RluA family pseudouridine synthase [Eubacterium sp.]MCM1417332.1 RluA family pseudouridine synthase [Roseburia sp.]MCM1461475.1 RluA family pseudouridine synthase [Bacteroides sp.]
MRNFEIEVDEAKAGTRLDKFIFEETEGTVTRSTAARLIWEGRCNVNGEPCPKNYKVRVGDRIELTVPEPEGVSLIPEDIPLEIVYEDDDLLVVNKPKGMVVHPAAGHPSGTLVNALMAHCGSGLSGINGEIRPGIVHRIDKNTSGLLVVAKSDLAHRGLAEQIAAHSFTREYEAVVCGAVTEDGTVDAPIGRSKSDRKKMCVTEDGRDARTHYYIIKRFAGYTYLRLRLETGRTHQIRVHMAYIGHPVAGDEVYGNGRPRSLGGQCLHARRIGFIHPRDGRYVEFDSELPQSFQDFLDSIE